MVGRHCTYEAGSMSEKCTEELTRQAECGIIHEHCTSAVDVFLGQVVLSEKA